MGGEKTTGMGNVINRNAYRKRQGRDRRAMLTENKRLHQRLGETLKKTGQWSARLVTKKGRSQRRIEKSKRDKLEEREAERLAKEEEGAGEQAEETVGMGLDENIEGKPLADFSKELTKAILKRQRETKKKSASEMDFIDVIFDRRFIDAIEDAEVLTPREKVNRRYADVTMQKRREQLAEGLRRKNLSKFYSDDLDIIYATALSDAKFWNETTWDSGKPTPPDAFFRFLESVALRTEAKTRGREGENDNSGNYIGNVFKALYDMKGISRPEEETLGDLIDPALVDRYVKERSGRQVGIMIEDFRELVSDLLERSRSELHPELKVPGLGFRRITNDEVNAKEAKASAALKKLDETTFEEAKIRVEQAREEEAAKGAEYEALMEKIENFRQNEETGEAQLSKQQRNKVADIERMASDALEMAVGARRNAEKILEIKTNETPTLVEEAKEAEGNFEKARLAEVNAKKEYGRVLLEIKNVKRIRHRETHERLQAIEEEKTKSKQKLEDTEKRREEARKALETADKNLEIISDLEETLEERVVNLLGPNQATEGREKAAKEYIEAQEDYDLISTERGWAERAIAGLEDMFVACLSEFQESTVKLSDVAQGMEWRNPSVMEWLDKAKQLPEKKLEISKLENLELKKAKDEILEILKQRDYIGKLMQAAGGDEKFKKQKAELFTGMVGKFKEGIQDKALDDDVKQTLDRSVKELETLAALPNLGIPTEKERDGFRIREGVENELLVAQIEYDIISADATARFNKVVGDFKAELKKAKLPDEIKVQIEKVADKIAASGDPTAEDINEDTNGIGDMYAYPIRKAAELVIRRFESETEKIGRISNKQAIIVRNIWLETQAETDPLQFKREMKLWKSLKSIALWNLAGQSWRERAERIADMTSGVREDFKPERRFENLVAIAPKTKAPYRHWMKRWMGGAAKIFVASQVVFLFGGGFRACIDEDTTKGCVGLQAGCENITSRQHPEWEGKAPLGLGLVEWLFNRRGSPLFSWELLFRRPYIVDAHARRIVNDSYDIPERLAGRGERYYRKIFGMGRQLSHETDNDGVEDRLEWLRDNPDVLRFFQERRTLRVVHGNWKVLYESREDVKKSELSNVCNIAQEKIEKKKKKKKAKKKDKEAEEKPEEEEEEEEEVETREKILEDVPASCTNLGLTWENIGDDELAEEEIGWEKGQERPWRKGKDEVCCLIEMKPVPIRDGLKLNRYEADRFIAMLMAEGRGGLKIEDVDRRLATRTELTRDDLEVLGIENPEGVDLDRINSLLKQRRTGNEEAQERAVEDLEKVVEELGKSIPARKINHEYLTKLNNRARWIEQRFLIPANEDRIMEEYGIGKREIVEMVVVHSKKIEEPLLKPLMKKGDARWYLDKTHMAAFLAHMRMKIMEEDERPDMDPSTDSVSAEAIKSAFEKTMKTAQEKGWVTDCTVEYEVRLLREKIKQLFPPKIKERLVSDDVSAFINDDTLHILQAQEDIRTLVLKFTEGRRAYRLGSYRVNDFVQLLSKHKRRGRDVDDFDPFTTPKGSKVDWAIGKKYIVSRAKWHKPGQSAKVIDSSAAGAMETTEVSYKEMQELDDIVAGVIAGMGGKAEKEEAAITKELKRLVASKKKADIQKRKGWKGIKVDEEGNVEVTNMDKAMKDMDFFIKTFLKLRGRRR